MENWGLLLKRLRVLHGLTQERIGDMFGVSQRTVSRWERNENLPSPQCRRRLRELGSEPSEAPADSRPDGRPDGRADGRPDGRADGRVDGPAAAGGHSPFPGGLARASNLPPQSVSLNGAELEEDRMLQEDHSAVALAERVVALLGHLSPDDIRRLPPEGRRRLAERCRAVLQAAAPAGRGRGKG